MGDAADDSITGLCCSMCSSYFEQAHGYEVVCRECWKTLDGNEKRAHQLATEDILTDEDAPWQPLSIPRDNPDRIIAGIDEVGMGAVAGECLVAVVAIGEGVVAGVRDSKKCSRDTRWVLAGQIRQKAKFIYIASRTPQEIDRDGLIQSWVSAVVECRDAVQKAIPGIEIMCDGLPDQRVDRALLKGIQFIPRGDDNVFAIAAASIVAKDCRDNIMLEYAKKYPQYKFEDHVGYGTPTHWNRIRQYGPCPIHRKQAHKNKLVTQKEEMAPFDPVRAKQILGELSNFIDRPWVGEWERSFVTSVKQQLDRKNSLSPKQMHYLITTYHRVLKEAKRR